MCLKSHSMRATVSSLSIRVNDRAHGTVSLCHVIIRKMAGRTSTTYHHITIAQKNSEVAALAFHTERVKVDQPHLCTGNGWLELA